LAYHVSSFYLCKFFEGIKLQNKGQRLHSVSQNKTHFLSILSVFYQPEEHSLYV